MYNELRVFGNKIVHEWVLAYVDIPENEAADRFTRHSLLEMESPGCLKLEMSEAVSGNSKVIFHLTRELESHGTSITNPL